MAGAKAVDPNTSSSMTEFDCVNALVKTLKRLLNPDISKKTLLAGFSRSGIRDGLPDPSHQIDNPDIFEPGKQFRSSSLPEVTKDYLKELYSLPNMISPHRSPISGITYPHADTVMTAVDALAAQGGIGEGTRIAFLFHLAKTQDKKGELIADAVYRGRVGVNAEQRARQILELNHRIGYDDDGSLDSDSDDCEESIDMMDLVKRPRLGPRARVDTTYGAPVYGATAKSQYDLAFERKIEKTNLGIEKEKRQKRKRGAEAPLQQALRRLGIPVPDSISNSMMNDFIEDNDIKSDIKAKLSNWSSAKKEIKIQALTTVLEAYVEADKENEKGIDRKVWIQMKEPSNKKQKTF